MSVHPAYSRDADSRPAGGFLLGFAFSGFFDGILLHQVLQWHHLLSLVRGEAFRDPRVQIAADGLFHVAMYALALAGVWRLWRAKPLWRQIDGRRFWARFVLGFGVWNLIDIVIFHWLLGFHHVRVDVADWRPWDIGWLVGLGLAPIGLGWALGKGGGRRGSPAVPVLLMALTLGAGLVNLKPAPRGRTAAVMFWPGTSDRRIMTALAASNARLVEAGPPGLVVVALAEHSTAWSLYRRGALLVSGAGPAGCLAWSKLPRLPPS